MTGRPLSLAAKALIVQLAAIGLITGAVAIPRYFALRTGLYAGIESSAQSLVQVLEDMIAEDPGLLQHDALDASVDHFANKLPAVARVIIIGGDSMIVADSRSDGAARGDAALLPLLSRVSQEKRYFTIAGEPLLRWSRSLRGRYDSARHSDIAGVASVEMRLALTNAAIRRELVAEMTLVLLLLVPISGLLYYRTRRTFVRPLEQLASAGAVFARGDVPPPLTFGDRDELAGVAQAFNEMVAARTGALKDRERQLRDAQAIAHIGSWEMDLASHRVTWSDEAYSLWGVPLGSPVDAARFVAGVHQEDRERVERLTSTALAQRRDIEFDCRIVRPDGETRHVLIRNVVIPGPTGEPTRLAGTCLDITDRKRAEDALAQSERYHRALIEHALDLTTLVDADGFVRYASPSYEPVLGYRPAEVIGRRVFDLVHPDDLATTLAIFTEGSATPHATRAHEFRFLHQDGSWRVLAAVGRNLFDDPVINAAIINARDITEKQRAQQHEKALLRELQQAMSEVKVLQGILPICASCKRIKNDGGGWEQVESYVRGHTNAEFSHGLCPDCAARDWGAAPSAAGA